MKNIVLVGLPGSGKTMFGAQLAAALNRPFVDLDEAICRLSGQSIPELFARHGEAYFRELETQALAQACKTGGIVLSTGGGSVLRSENRAIMKENGLVLFLDRSVQDILADINTAHRPLLSGSPDALAGLSRQRRALYLASADFTVANDACPQRVLLRLRLLCQLAQIGDFAVIGDPIGHSLSPLLQGAMFAAQGLSFCYGAVHVPTGQLAEFVHAARLTRLRGFNVTIPHKQAIIPFLDTLDESAALCGAVNTVALEDGKLVGYNTDMDGLQMAIQAQGFAYRGRSILIFGSGGAAKATATKALLCGARRVLMAARNTEAARAFAGRQAGVVPLPWQEQAMQAACAQADILINATPLGMDGHGTQFESLAFLHKLPPHALVVDLVYAPQNTALLSQAKRLGKQTMGGMDMLIYQAILAQERFLQKPLPREKLYAAATQALQRSE